MTSSALVTEPARAAKVRVTDAALVVDLHDGRQVSVPLEWYPRLAAGHAAQRRRWELIGPGVGIHWPDLNEDISVDALLLGQRSNESVTSLRKWQASRRRRTAKRARSSRARS
jgi:hypothetical protein